MDRNSVLAYALPMSNPSSFHVTLIRPSFVLPVTSHQAQQGVPPLTLALLAATLKKHEYQVTCIDATGEKLGEYHDFGKSDLLAQGLTIHEVTGRIPSHTNVIGISCMFANEWVYSRQLLQLIREKFPGAVIIAGGEHVSADFTHILKQDSGIDICVRGEGEETLLELLEKIRTSDSWKEVVGISYLEQDEIKSTADRKRIINIDEIPWADWSAVPLRNYLDQGMGNDTQRKRSVPLIASRGCPYRCTFCTSPQMWGTRWIARDPHDVINEMKQSIRIYDANHFEFYDLTAIINKNWIHTFCDLLTAEKLEVSWSLPTGTRTEVLDRPTLAKIKASGCIKMTLAPESGSMATLERIKKKTKPEAMLKVIRNCRKEGMITKCNMIFGFPDQTMKEVFQSFVYIFRMALAGANDVACFSFVPYAGSELFNQLVASGKIIRDENYDDFLSRCIYNDTADIRSWSESIPQWLMPMLVMGGMLFFYVSSFLIRPWRFFQLIGRLLTSQPVTMLEMLLAGIYRNFIEGKKLKPRPALKESGQAV